MALTCYIEVAGTRPAEVDDRPPLQWDVVREEGGEFLKHCVGVPGANFPEALPNGFLERLTDAANLELAVVDLDERQNSCSLYMFGNESCTYLCLDSSFPFFVLCHTHNLRLQDVVCIRAHRGGAGRREVRLPRKEIESRI